MCVKRNNCRLEQNYLVLLVGSKKILVRTAAQEKNTARLDGTHAFLVERQARIAVGLEDLLD